MRHVAGTYFSIKSMSAFLITGTGTGVGKTLLTCGLCHQLEAMAVKPLITGFSYEDMESDTVQILHSMKWAVTRENIDSLSPWRWQAPLSPHMAAAVEGNMPTVQEVASFCRRRKVGSTLFFAETAGGLMSPLNDHATMLDLADTLRWPVILVAGSYLGAISHTLTALAALSSRGIFPHAVVISESKDSIGLEETAESIRLFTEGGGALYTLPRVHQADPWKYLPALGEICLSPPSLKSSRK